MASPQLENGYIKIANELTKAFCCNRIRGQAWQVLWSILHKTYGYNKKEDWISHSQIVILTGLKKGNVSRELSILITMNIVIRSDNRLSLNKNYDTWKLSKVITKKSLSEVITPVIRSDTKVIRSDGNKRQYTKDNTTKDITVRTVSGFGNPQINEVRDYFLKVFQLPKEDGSIKWNRIYWNNLIKQSKSGISGVKWLIDMAYQDEFLRPNITSAKSLSNKQVMIVSRRRGKIQTNKIAVNPAIKEET